MPSLRALPGAYVRFRCLGLRPLLRPLLRHGVLVGALLRRAEDDTCVPVTVHAYDPAPASGGGGAVVVCRAYGPRVAEDVRVDPDALECLWALVRTRTALPEVCMLS